MKIRAFAAGAIAISGIILLFAAGVPAQAPAVRVLASNGVQGALTEIIPQCEHAIGHPLAVEFGTTASIKPRIEGGEAFDVLSGNTVVEGAHPIEFVGCFAEVTGLNTEVHRRKAAEVAESMLIQCDLAVYAEFGLGAELRACLCFCAQWR